MPGYRAVVTSTAERPLLFLDVDGPLIPFVSSSGHPRAAAAAAVRAADQGNSLLARLDPGIGHASWLWAAISCGRRPGWKWRPSPALPCCWRRGTTAPHPPVSRGCQTALAFCARENDMGRLLGTDSHPEW